MYFLTNVFMKTKLLSIAASLLLAASANMAFADDTFYLSGAFNNWGNVNQQGGSPNIQFNYENGEYTLEYKFEGEFKIVKNNTEWYGYGQNVAYTTISNDNPLTLYTNNSNLYLGFPTTYKLTVKIVDNNPQLTVTGFPEEGLYLVGAFNSWDPEILSTNSDGSYTITKNVSEGDQFKFRDADGNWYGGNTNDPTYNIKNEWRSYMSISSPGEDFKFTGTPGICTFVITDNGNKLTVLGYGEDLVSLSDNAENNFSTTSSGVDVVINGRTLYGGEWNTLCLPFDVYDGNYDDNTSFSGTLLQGAEVKTLSSSSFADGSLTLTFSDASTIVAGVPYIVKVNSNIANPRFTNVTISTTTPGQSGSGVATFNGCFDPTEITGSNNLYLGAANTLYYPSSSVTINPFRAYFKLNLPSGQQVKSFVLNFDDDTETTSIKQINNTASATDSYFTLDGRHLNDKPATPGLYIINGKKVVIK